MSSMKPTVTGLVEVFTGEGRGKTSAALGTAVRALGNGLRVRIVAFMKAGRSSGEWNIFEGLPSITVSRYGSDRMVDPENPRPADKEGAAAALAAGREALLSGDYDLVILDEINVAASWRLIDIKDVIALVEDKPERVELILTGRYADKEIVRRADQVTEMLNIKHPYDQGTPARKGIDY